MGLKLTRSMPVAKELRKAQLCRTLKSMYSLLRVTMQFRCVKLLKSLDLIMEMNQISRVFK